VSSLFLVANVHARSLSNRQAKHSPDDCICLTRDENTVGGIIKGMYSYVDPVGSLIEVSYTMNTDKTDYKEERKVTKAYANSAPPDTQRTPNIGGLTVEEVVERVLKDLSPTVVTVVRATVQGSNRFDLSSQESRAQIVVQILNQLRPVVFQIVTEVLEITSTTYLDAEELTNTIMIRLTPIIEIGVNEESEKVLNSEQTKVQKNNLVLQITSELKPTIISVIKATVAQSDLSNFDGLLAAILRQLRPVVLRACEVGLASSNLDLDANELADEIMVELTPFVSTALEKEVQQASTLSEAEVVQIIITDLKPTVIKVIQATVGSTKNLGDTDQLLQTILRQMRPVVLNAAQNALQTSPVAGNIDANSLTNKVITQMTGFVTQTVTSLVGNRVADLESQVVKQVTTELKPTVIQVVQATTQSAGIDTSDAAKLLETILVQLRPVVLNEVRNALKTSDYPLDAQSLTVRIVKELRPFVSEALKKELAKVNAEAQKKAASEVISEVTAELEPAVIKVIESVVGASGVDLNNPQQLVELILAQLRPVVFNAVIKALKSSPYKNIDPQKLTVRIIIELTPFVENGVNNQVQAIKAENDGLIRELIDRLNPAIKNTIAGLQGNNIPQDLADEIVRVTPPKVQGLIANKVAALGRQPGSDSLSDSVFVDRVLADMQGDIIAAIKAVDRYRVVLNKPGFGSIMQRIMAILRDLIARQRQLYLQSLIPVTQKPRPKPTPKPVVEQSLSNIFGTGDNFVRVESPNVNYGYEFDARRK